MKVEFKLDSPDVADHLIKEIDLLLKEEVNTEHMPDCLGNVYDFFYDIFHRIVH